MAPDSITNYIFKGIGKIIPPSIIISGKTSIPIFTENKLAI